MSFLRLSLVAALSFTILLGPWTLSAQNTSAVTAKDRAGELHLWQSRENWFYGQRTFPGRRLPHNARLNALRELDQMLASEAAATSNTSPSKLQWTQIGPMPSGFWNSISNGGSSGRVTALAVDPNNASVVYLGTAGGGVWKTTDGGLHWAPLTDTQASLAVGALALDPSNSSVLYVGTGEANSSVDSYYGSGILKSTDGGNTWANYPGPFVDSNGGGTSFGSLAIHPSNGSIVLAGTYSGIYRSTDAGVNWSSVLPGGTGYSVAFNASDGNIAYAAIGSIFGAPANGIYKSTDGGSTWTRLTGTGALTSRWVRSRLPKWTFPETIQCGIAREDCSFL